MDHATSPDRFKRYLDTVTGVDAAQAFKQRSYEMLHLRPGMRVLDVGCGTGEDVRALAKLVAPGGAAVGIDSSETMIAEARKRSAGVDSAAEFRRGDAVRLEFEDNSFDATRSERTFQHLREPKRALREMVRVTRRGGRLVVLDPDWETVVIDAPDPLLTRRILTAGCDAHVDGWAGRKHFASFKELGLVDIEVIGGTVTLLDYPLAEAVLELAGCVREAVAARVVTEAEGVSWLQSLQARARDGQFFSAISGFTVAGTKP